MKFSKTIIIFCVALASHLALADVTRINLGPPVPLQTPCSKIELKQLYNATTRTAPQEVIVFADIDAPSVNTFRGAIEQCLALATATAGLNSIALSPAAAAPSFKGTFYVCAKAKAAELATANVELGIKSICKWSGDDNSPAPPDPVVSEPVFNAGFYISIQDEVREAQGNDLGKAEQHWRNYGISEGRRGSRAFDPQYYLSSHPDLVAAYGSKNFNQAILHWLAYGQTEGRAISYEFDPKYYLSIYDDLRKAYGDKGYLAATIHWITFGIKEGRRGSAQFDVAWYLANNDDLRKSFGEKGYEAAFDHWVHFGRKEPRKGIQ